MEDLKSLRIKKQMLLIELNALEQKISLLETTTTDAFPVNDASMSTSPSTTVIFEQEDESLKSKAIPEQTAPGKETTKPLTADALLKSKLKGTTDPDPCIKTSKLATCSSANLSSDSIGRMTTLSPTNHSVQELVPDYKKALKKEASHFYVIYKGPHAGVYTDWGIAERYVKEDKVTCKKFRNEESARLSLATYSDESTSTKITLLKPKIEKKKKEHSDQRFKVPDEIQDEVFNTPIEFETFRQLWNKARSACPEDLLHEKFFTTDKKTKSLFNFIEGADPELIRLALSAGLVHNIYPSSNLQEIKHFPKAMIEAIKTFRRKVLKAKDEPLYINCISSLPDWNQEIRFEPYHFLEIGLAKNREVSNSQAMEDRDLPLPEIINPVRIQGLRRIAEKVLDALSSKKKVNYASKNCIIVSWSFNNTSKEDLEKLSKFGEDFMKNTIECSSTTRQTFCRHASQLFEDHYCNHCNNSVDGPSTTEEDKTSTE